MCLCFYSELSYSKDIKGETIGNTLQQILDCLHSFSHFLSHTEGLICLPVTLCISRNVKVKLGSGHFSWTRLSSFLSRRQEWFNHLAASGTPGLPLLGLCLRFPDGVPSKLCPCLIWAHPSAAICWDLSLNVIVAAFESRTEEQKIIKLDTRFRFPHLSND